MPSASSPELLVLHALRLLGYGDASAIARRFALDRDATTEQLLDAEARGQVERVAFADVSGWSLTARGHAAHAALVADELAASGAKPAVEAALDRFLPLNARLQRAATDWQIRPLPGDALAANDHTDARWDDRVLDELVRLVRAAAPLCADLKAALDRFGGYDVRLQRAMQRVEQGERSYVDRPRVDSVHTVWFELHEDLLATLGRSRG